MYGFVFDLDGCLIDSSSVQKEAFWGSYKVVVGNSNCPSYDEYIKYTGDSIENVLKKLNLPNEMASYFRKISRESIDKIIVNWEAIHLVESYKKKGIPIAICTGKDRDRTIEILHYYNISHLFDHLICADDVLNPKPSPEPIIKAMKKMNIEKEETIVIGDGYNDILSAKAAGTKSILTRWYGKGYMPIECKYIADNVTQLKAIILEICNNEGWR